MTFTSIAAFVAAFTCTFINPNNDAGEVENGVSFYRQSNDGYGETTPLQTYDMVETGTESIYFNIGTLLSDATFTQGHTTIDVVTFSITGSQLFYDPETDGYYTMDVTYQNFLKLQLLYWSNAQEDIFQFRWVHNGGIYSTYGYTINILIDDGVDEHYWQSSVFSTAVEDNEGEYSREFYQGDFYNDDPRDWNFNIRILVGTTMYQTGDYIFDATVGQYYDQGYNDGYAQSKVDNYQDFYDEGFNNGVPVGYENGYANGYDVGASEANTYSFNNLFKSIIDTPIWFLQSIMGFELFGTGTSLIAIVTSLVTLCLLIMLIKKVF